MFNRRKNNPAPSSISAPPLIPQDWLRYSSSIHFEPLGLAGQEKLQSKTIAVLGLGALGTNIAESLCRLGIGKLVLVDRDIVLESNLSRQTLYTSFDASASTPKAIASAAHLAAINPLVSLEPHVSDINFRNIYNHVRNCDLIMDGSDNFELRHLINQVSVSSGFNWIYAGVMAARTTVMAIIPHRTPCLSCLISLDHTPIATCASVGVFEPAVKVAASMAATLAVQLLVTGAPLAGLFHADLWNGHCGWMQPAVDPNCPVCRLGEMPHLRGKMGLQTRAVCGADGVEIWPEHEQELDLGELYSRLQSAVSVEWHDYFLRLRDEQVVITLFPDGRAFVKGTHDEGQARAALARYLG